MTDVLLAALVIAAPDAIPTLAVVGTMVSAVFVFAGLLVRQNVLQGGYWPGIVAAETSRADAERERANAERDRADRREAELAQCKILCAAAEAQSAMLGMTNDELRRQLAEARTPPRRPRRTEVDP